jgi:hypothetical protein
MRGKILQQELGSFPTVKSKDIKITLNIKACTHLGSGN